MNLADFKRVDASEFGLSKRVALYKDSKEELTFIVSRKSRFIKSDADKVIERAKQVEAVSGKYPRLIIAAPLCSKAEQHLKDNGVVVVSLKN